MLPRMNKIAALVENRFMHRSCLEKKLQNFQEWVKRALVNFVANNGCDEADDWVLDSGSAFHAVKDKNLLRNIRPCEACAYGFSGQSFELCHVGEALLPVDQFSNEFITLQDVYYVQDLKKNLISVSRLTADLPYSVEFDPIGFVVEDLKTQKIVATGQQFCNLYYWPGIKLTLGRIIKAFSNMVFLKTRINSRLDNIVDNEKVNHLCFLDSDAPPQVDDDLWILDSGAPIHMANIEARLQDLCPCKVKSVWNDLQGRESVVTHVGTAHLGPRNHGIMLCSVQLVPRIADNLISVAALTSDSSCCVKFDSGGFVLRSLDTNKVLARGKKFDNVYYLSYSSFVNRKTRLAAKDVKRRSRNKKRNGKSGKAS